MKMMNNTEMDEIMKTMSSTQRDKIMKMTFHLYATSEDVPESPLAQDWFLDQAMATATEFTRRWKDAGLPEERLLDGFCNEDIRACVLMNLHLHIKFTDTILDSLTASWQRYQVFAPQRELLRHIEEKHQQYKQAIWGEQQ